MFAAGIMTAKPSPANSSPSENFTGLDGFAPRFPSANQMRRKHRRKQNDEDRID